MRDITERLKGIANDLRKQSADLRDYEASIRADDRAKVIGEVARKGATVEIMTEGGAFFIHNPPAEARTIEALANLIAVLDEAMPHVESAITIATMHHCPYKGPSIKEALDEARGLVGG